MLKLLLHFLLLECLIENFKCHGEKGDRIRNMYQKY